MDCKYEYQRIREPFNTRVFLDKVQKKLFGNPTNFIWAMIIYHILILLFTFSLQQEIPAKVMLRLGLGDVTAVNAEMQAVQSLQHSITNILFLAIVLFLDFALLVILRSEFKPLHLTYGKIMILELLIFLAGILNPYIRTALLFFSANTLQIAIAYRWLIKKWVVFQYFFLLGSYILILKLLFYVIWMWI